MYSCSDSYVLKCNPSSEIVIPDTVTVAIQSDYPLLELLSALGPLAILISASIAAVVAIRGLRVHRATARRRATADLLFRLEVDPEYLKSEAAYQDARDSGRLCSIFDSKSARDKEERLDVQTFMNHYELIACGIMEDALDELFYFRWYRGTLLKHWEETKELVHHLRDISKNRQIYARFEQLATSWQNDAFVTRRHDKPSIYLNGANKTRYYQD